MHLKQHKLTTEYNRCENMNMWFEIRKGYNYNVTLIHKSNNFIKN